MSVMTIYEHSPIGALVIYYDSTPRPSEDDAEAFAAWTKRNGGGWLARCAPPRSSMVYSMRGAITLLRAFPIDLDAAVAAREDFPLESDLTFAVVRHPAAGEFRVLQEYGAHSILLYLAKNRPDAERWVKESGHINIRLEEVTAEEVCADVIEGRAA